jgi:hypothetical protein
MANILDKLIRNKNGEVVLWQTPNLLLWGWIIFSILAMIIKHPKIHTGLHFLGSASLFTWAYFELRSGESMFRRVLGAAILLVVAYSYFR